MSGGLTSPPLMCCGPVPDSACEFLELSCNIQNNDNKFKRFLVLFFLEGDRATSSHPSVAPRSRPHSELLNYILTCIYIGFNGWKLP